MRPQPMLNILIAAQPVPNGAAVLPREAVPGRDGRLLAGPHALDRQRGHDPADVGSTFAAKAGLDRVGLQYGFEPGAIGRVCHNGPAPARSAARRRPRQAVA